jgi:putative transcriptional regulator
MRITSLLTDAAVLAELGQRLERTRLERNITQQELAREAGITRGTVVRLEHGDSVGVAVLLRVLRAVDLLDRVDQLVPEPLPSPIEQLHLQGRRRQRASGGRRDDVAAPWTWGDETSTQDVDG